MKDFVGKTFNGLTGVRPGETVPGKFKTWVWKCVCGNEVEYRSCVVVSGHVKSCGCRNHLITEVEKLCKTCGEVSDRKTKKGSWACTCKKCYNKACNHSDNPVVFLLARARQRAKDLSLPCALTREDIIIPEFCPILGMRMSLGTMKERDSSPSLDRVVPSLGYIPSNVAVISHLANRIKNTGTAEQHRRIADWMDAQSEAANA